MLMSTYDIKIPQYTNTRERVFDVELALQARLYEGWTWKLPGALRLYMTDTLYRSLFYL